MNSFEIPNWQYYVYGSYLFVLFSILVTALYFLRSLKKNLKSLHDEGYLDKGDQK